MVETIEYMIVFAGQFIVSSFVTVVHEHFIKKRINNAVVKVEKRLKRELRKQLKKQKRSVK